MTASRLFSCSRPSAAARGDGLAGVMVRAAALAAMLAASAAPVPAAAGTQTARSVLDVGGRVIAFEAQPATVVQFTLPFEIGNALLLQEALQRLRQPDLGPFGASGGAVLHIVSIGGGDRKLAFERARTVRAALVRLGTAEPRGLAAAARVGEGSEGAAAVAPGDTRIETVAVTVLRLTRASCAACSATTLATAAMDTGAVGLVTLETGRSADLAASPASGARTADRREPETNLNFTDRPPLAREEQGAVISPVDARALGAAAAAAAAAPVQPAPAPRAGIPPAGVPQAAAPPAPAPVASPPARSARKPSMTRGRVSAEAVKLADLRALGRKRPPGCHPRRIVIDDYLPPQQGWQCGSR